MTGSPHRGRRSNTSLPSWVGLGVFLVSLATAAILVLPLGLTSGSTTAAQPSGVAFPPADSEPGAVGAVPQGDSVDDSRGNEADAPDAAPPIPGQPVALSIPSVGLTTSVRSMTVEPGGSVDPPGPRYAYWLAPYGTAGPQATNTVYIAGHTFRRGGAVFNPLLDVAHEQSAVTVGAEIEIQTQEGVYSYTVTAVERYDKVSVDQQSELWKQVPGRLVIVTCFQYDSGQASTQNLVVFAQLDAR